MPEGDTIHKLARILGESLADATLAEVYVRGRGEIALLRGARVERIQAVGKHMIIALSGDRGLRIHLGMKGSWRRYPRAVAVAGAAAGTPGTRGGEWKRFGARASVVLATATDAFVCLGAGQVELLAGTALDRNRVLDRLGPDLLSRNDSAPERAPAGGPAGGPASTPGSEPAIEPGTKPDTTIDYAEICKRARQPWRRQQAIAELLLDQTVASGIGNVYKSEVLFLRGVHPRTPVAQLDDQALTAIYAEAARLMRANLGPGGRVTVMPVRRIPGSPRLTPRYWVYGRHHQPCMRCRTMIQVFRQGDHARSTYWCPRCQPA
jgi:endonuclease-8